MGDATRWKLPSILLSLYLIEFIGLAIQPHDRAVWLIENLPMMCIVLVLVLTYRRFQFSNAAYAIMSVLVFLHTIGGHYTFERVPFGPVSNLIGADRNHFDRLAHFTVGFYAFAVAEFVDVRQLTRSRWLTCLFAIASICSVALAYEIFEWIYAISADPGAGAAFLGSQGDPWDAQKDMLADTLGAIVATVAYIAIAQRRNRRSGFLIHRNPVAIENRSNGKND